MDRQLPVYYLGEERFYADLERWQFRQVDNPANTISLDHLKEREGHTFLVYDKRTKNAFTGGVKAFKEAGGNAIKVKLPIAPRLDYEGAQALLWKFMKKVRADLRNMQENKPSIKQGKGKKL